VNRSSNIGQLRSLVFAATLLVSLTCSAAAQAKWGPSNNCGIKSAPVNEHCYALAYRGTKTLASIAADDNEVAIVYDWASGGFYDQEQWASWPGAPGNEKNGWVESGITEGNYINCCTAYPFYASETQTGSYHEVIATGPVASGSGEYNYTLIFDPEYNGVYHVYWSAATNTAQWFEVAQFGGGRPVDIEENEGGLEAATEDNPYHAGRQEVAVSNGGAWYPWSGASWYKSPGTCIGHNREQTAEGNIEWDPGHNEC
jgi:hypothetical protein